MNVGQFVADRLRSELLQLNAWALAFSLGMLWYLMFVLAASFGMTYTDIRPSFFIEWAHENSDWPESADKTPGLIHAFDETQGWDGWSEWNSSPGWDEPAAAAVYTGAIGSFFICCMCKPLLWCASQFRTRSLSRQSKVSPA